MSNNPSPAQKNQLPALLLSVLLLFIFAVLIYGATKRYMREDEAIALDGTSRGLFATVDRQVHDVHGPTYFVSFYLWQQFVGSHEFTSRVFSILISMLTLSVVYQLGRRWFGGKWIGAASLLALGLSSYFFVYAIEIRPYAEVMLLAAVSTWYFLRWLEQRTWHSALTYGLTVAMMLYLHYFGTFLILMHGLYFLLQGKRTLPLWKQGVGLMATAFVWWLPWFPIFIYQLKTVSALLKPQEVRATGINIGMASTTQPTTWPTIQKFIQVATNAQPLVYAVVIIVGAILLWRKQRYWLAVAWGIGFPVSMFLVNLVVPVYDGRYASPLIPGLAVLVGMSLMALPGLWKVAAVGVFSVLTLLTVQTGVVDRPPLRDYLQQFEAAYHPGDGVYLDRTGDDNQVWLQYGEYAPTAWAQAQWIDDQIKGDRSLYLTTDTPLPRCVWHITPDWFNKSVQAHFHLIEATHPLQQVIGDQRYLFQRLCGPPKSDATLFGNSLRFFGDDIESVTKTQITLKMWWSTYSPPQNDLSMGVYLLEQNGTRVAQHDGPINDFYGKGTIQTSALMPNIYYIDHRTLDIPQNLPPGQYKLALVVYQPWDLMRLTFNQSKDDMLIFDTISLP